MFTGVAGAPYYSNHYFPTTATSAEAQASAALVTGFWQQIQTLLRTPMRVQVDPFAPEINQVTGEITGAYTVTGPSLTFTATAEALPPATQMLVSLNTGVFAGGRQIRGRCFIPGWTEASNGPGGLPNDDVKTAVQTAYVNALGSGGRRTGVWSRKNGTFTQISGVGIGTQWAVLRSRRD